MFSVCKDAFFDVQQGLLLLDHLAFSLTMKAADAAVGCDDAMAGYFWSKWVALEGLADGLRTATADALAEFLVRDSLSPLYLKESKIDTALKFRNVP